MAIINSRIFLWMVLSAVKNAVLAYCWVIVEPPCNPRPIAVFIAPRKIAIGLKAP